MEYDYDAIVIGGGITGAGIARDAAMRGLRVLVIEANAIGAATTSASSELIHGGLKYQRDDVKITKLSCIDAGVLVNIAPFLVTRQIFVIPVYPEDRYGVRLWDMFLLAYDQFVEEKFAKRHLRLSTEALSHIEPRLRDGAAGAVTFDEWRVDPKRLTRCTIASAVMHGAEVCEGFPVTAIDPVRRSVQMHVSVPARTTLLGSSSGTNVTLRARAIVNAAGPWAEEVARMFRGDVRLRPTRGSHLIVGKRLSDHGIVLEAKDGKPVFLMPLGDRTMIGPTNVMHYGPASECSISSDEIAYLLEAANRVLRDPISQEDIVDTKSGLRPQLHHWGVDEDHISHDYAVYDHAKEGMPGLFTVVGGKLSMYRKMAQDATNALCAFLDHPGECRTHLEMLPDVDALDDVDTALRVPVPVAIHIPNTSLALSSHTAIAKTALRKRIRAYMRLAYFTVRHAVSTVRLRRRPVTQETFLRHYQEVRDA